MTKACKRSLRIESIIAVLLLFSLFCQVYADASSGPQPPPVEISLTTENINVAPGDEVVLHLKVTPLEDMHLDISCVLPEGVMPVMVPGIMLRPYMERDMHRFDDPFMGMPMQRDAVVLSVGPVVGGQMREFAFRVIIPETGNYEFIAVIEALAKWGIKEKNLIIEVK